MAQEHAESARDVDWVVLGESGEYSNREVWVSGVYRSEAEARAKIEERMTVRRQYEEWDWKRTDHFNVLQKAANKAMQEQLTRHTIEGNAQAVRDRPWAMEWQRTGYAAAQKAAGEAAGPEPEYEEAEQCSLFACPIDTWQATAPDKQLL